MSDWVVVRHKDTREIVHQEEHASVSPKRSADLLTQRYLELRERWPPEYEILTGFGPTLEEFLRLCDSSD
ncbi:MAG: hypothetical protein QN122_10070 [Armatimonadota bacterium]|nr:hypothetical protein [Armatimonadota bacterium]MDR7449675.1 hypothetical protein [Armatimonadota bacterium]MDR7460649.1 hypothetical protein [Armatimonadota bacterium]MDR7480718.1 hypothetical protein [Armatimonadota bacterium]MDR7489028.1 hypothetical protein [Armatimonadota bacterium]